jgi:hypothetical protein
MIDMEVIRERDEKTYAHYDCWECWRCGASRGIAAVAHDYDVECGICSKPMRLVSRRPRDKRWAEG